MTKMVVSGGPRATAEERPLGGSRIPDPPFAKRGVRHTFYGATSTLRLITRPFALHDGSARPRRGVGGKWLSVRRYLTNALASRRVKSGFVEVDAVDAAMSGVPIRIRSLRLAPAGLLTAGAVLAGPSRQLRQMPAPT